MGLYRVKNIKIYKNHSTYPTHPPMGHAPRLIAETKGGNKPTEKYYWTCPYCGAHLDPGEHCDCREKEAPPAVGENRRGDVGNQDRCQDSYIIARMSGKFKEEQQ